MHRRTFLRQCAATGGAGLGVPWLGHSLGIARTRGGLSDAILLSADDRSISPHTGFTRAHWLEIVERMLAGVLPYFDLGSGMPMLPGVAGNRRHAESFAGDSIVARWQAMERIMMLAVYYSAATGRDRVPGWAGSISEVFRTGIRRMTNPADTLYCPRKDPSVYLGSETALAALLCPRFFWEPFEAKEQARILDFAGELARQRAYDNNHHLFHLVPVPLLERHGRETYRKQLTPLIERMLSWDRGNGWLIDGSNQGFDYYNFWGFHLYFNALCHLDHRWRQAWGERIRGLTAEFMQTVPWFFGRDGSPIPWGRSVAYRFASISAIGWARLNGASPLAPGLSRRVASGVLKYFWDRGALHGNGVLELGYHGPNAAVAEPYLTDGTGYFAAQGFSCLLIPESDPFWTEPEHPMPADLSGGRLVVAGAELVVRVSPMDGEARMFTAGQRFGQAGKWQRGTKYCQLAYSSDVGWCASGEGGEDLGAGRTGYSFDEKSWTFRQQPVATRVEANQVSGYEPMTEPGNSGSSSEMHCHTLIGDAGEVQVFWHTNLRAAHLYLGGYGISVGLHSQLATLAAERGLLLQAGEYFSWMEQLHGPSGRFASQVVAPRNGWRHSHLFGGRGAFPFWRSTKPVPAFTPILMYVDGGRRRQAATPRTAIQEVPGMLRITFEGRDVEVPLRPASALLR